MYDCIVTASGTLPAGVELIEVLEEAADEAVTQIVASMPRKGDALSAQDMVAAGGTLARMTCQVPVILHCGGRPPCIILRNSTTPCASACAKGRVSDS